MKQSRGIFHGGKLDDLSTIALANIVTLVSYFLLLAILAPIYVPDDESPLHYISLEDSHHVSLNATAIFIAIILGSTLALIMRKRRDKNEGKRASEDTALIKSMLSADEQKLIAAVEQATEITQDSLKFKLNWSRPKLSSNITSLERRGVVQRRHEGKTYVIFLAKR